MLTHIVNNLQDVCLKTFRDVYFSGYDIPTETPILKQYSLYMFDRHQILYRRCICRLEFIAAHHDDIGICIVTKLYKIAGTDDSGCIHEEYFALSGPKNISEIIEQLIDKIKTLDIKTNDN